MKSIAFLSVFLFFAPSLLSQCDCWSCHQTEKNFVCCDCCPDCDCGPFCDCPDCDCCDREKIRKGIRTFYVSDNETDLLAAKKKLADELALHKTKHEAMRAIELDVEKNLSRVASAYALLVKDGKIHGKDSLVAQAFWERLLELSGSASGKLGQHNAAHLHADLDAELGEVYEKHTLHRHASDRYLKSADQHRKARVLATAAGEAFTKVLKKSEAFHAFLEQLKGD